MSEEVVPVSKQVAEYRNSAMAINDYIEKSYNFMGEADIGASGGVWEEEIKAFVDAATLKALFFSEDWVFITVDLCANKLSSQRMWVMKETEEGGTTSVERIDDHPLNTLLDSPNQFQDYHAYMYNQVVEYFLEGNVITWYAPSNGSLTTLPTELITLDFATDCSVNKYLMSGTSGQSKTCADQVTEFDPKQIIHIRRPNPSSLLWGLSCFIPGRKSILFNRYSQDYLNSFYLKQALPAMKLEMDRQVNEDVALRQLRSFELAYSGRRNQRRTMILPKGVKADAISHTIADQKLLDTVKINRETILGLLKIPKHELGLQESGSLGSEEHKIALRNFWEATLIPASRMIEGAYTNYFRNLGMLEADEFFQFDLTEVEALQDDKLKKAETARAMLDAGLTINEVRTKVWQEEPDESPGSDRPFVLADRVVVQANPEPQQLGFSTQPGSGGDAIPTLMGEDEEEEYEIEDLKDIKNLDGFKTMLTPWRELVQKQIDETFENESEEQAELNLDMFLDMAERAIEVIKRTLKDEKSLSIKADIPSKKELRRRLERAMAGLEEQWVEDTSRVLRDSVELGYDTQLDLVINEPNKSQIQALRARDINQRRQLLSERLIDSFDQVSKTHTDRIMSEIVKGVEANENINQISRRVAETFADPEAMLAKSRTIARTETLSAVSVGQQAAIENATEVIPGLKKLWISAGDARVRDTHEDLDGTVIPVGETFKTTTGVRLRLPRDPAATGPDVAGQIINCRCVVAMIPPSEEGE